MEKNRNVSSGGVGYFDLVRNNFNFRNLWIGQIISLLGDWFNLIASASLIATLTQSGLAIGGLFVVRMLAPFLVSPIAGVMIDRYDRKNLLIISDIARGITVLGFLFVRSPEQVWILYVLSAVQMGFSGFFFPARNAILPDIVSPQALGTANTLSTSTWSVMLALGAALGGAAASQWGIYPSFVIDGFTFFLSAWFVYRLKIPVDRDTESINQGIREALEEYLYGLRYLLSHREVFAVSLLKSVMGFSISGAFQVIQIKLAEQVYIIGEGGRIGLGWMYAVVGIGTGLGPIIARKITGDHDRKMRIAIGAAYFISALGLIVIAQFISFEWVLLGSLLRGLGAGINWVFSTQLIFSMIPNHVRGRVFSTEFAMLTLMNATAATIGGWGIDQPNLGMQKMLYSMAGLVIFFGILWFLWIKKSINIQQEQ
ncbi:MAG: MFS transporter [Anaerolineae bacterium]|nr:MFS transporter [Anaerolineae bacterium]